ncbi:MAG: alpha-2-macroglobulin family protein [Gemmataceae bacterium]
MLTPERFHELLLDYAYDLLEPADAQAMRDYLAAHPEAASEVERARGLLAAAARSEFPAVRFEPPAARPAVQPRGPAQPAAKPMSRVWLTWVVAAVVLLAVGGVVGPGTRHLMRYSQQKQLADNAASVKRAADEDLQKLLADRRAAVAKAKQNVEDATTELTQLSAQEQKDLEEAQRKINDKHLVLIVTGPQAIQPGAPNHFQIATHNLNDAPVSARLTVRVRDQNDAVLFEEKEVASRGLHSLTLPPDLPYRPNTRLNLEVSAIDEVGPGQARVTETLGWSAPRYVTHLATDKPMYKPGETVYLRSLTLNRATMQPPAEDFQIAFTLTSPQGAKVWNQTGETRLQTAGKDGQRRPVLGPDGKPLRGVGAAQFVIPESAEGGEYVLSVQEFSSRFPEEKRKFLVNKYTPDRLIKELDFTRKSYGPGEEVVAVCKVSSEAGPMAGLQPRVSAQVDGVQISATALGVTDATGAVRVRAQLPTEMEHGRGSITVSFNDGGNEEAIVRPIPISLKKIFIEYFAEGGDLVAGVPNRVYFQAKTTADKPAELKARLVDSKGWAVANDIVTLHDDAEPGANQGMGVFSFEPKAGETYLLKIDEPAGIEAVGKFPAVKADGVSLSVPTGVTGGAEPIKVELYGSGRPRNLLVGAYCRGRLLDQQRVRTEPGQKATVELKADDTLGGVVRVTAFEEKAGDAGHTLFEPRAERLVFRRTAKKVQVSVQPDKSRYAPGDAVTLTVSATDEAGKPAAAVVNLSVVNQSVVTMADEKTFRNVNTHFALIGEVRKPEDLEHADFLLNETHPRAAAALDLLLGVQGWRRFAEQNPQKFREQNAQAAEGLLVVNGQSATLEQNSRDARLAEIESTYTPKLKDAAENLRLADVEREAVAQQGQTFGQDYSNRIAASRAASNNYSAAMAELAPFEETNREIQRAVLPGLATICLLMAVGLLVVARLRGQPRAVPYYVAAAASVGACLLLAFVATMSAERKTPGLATADATRATADGEAFWLKQEAKGLPADAPAEEKTAAGLGAAGDKGDAMPPHAFNDNAKADDKKFMPLPVAPPAPPGPPNAMPKDMPKPATAPMAQNVPRGAPAGKGAARAAARPAAPAMKKLADAKPDPKGAEIPDAPAKADKDKKGLLEADKARNQQFARREFRAARPGDMGEWKPQAGDGAKDRFGLEKEVMGGAGGGRGGFGRGGPGMGGGGFGPAKPGAPGMAGLMGGPGGPPEGDVRLRAGGFRALHAEPFLVREFAYQPAGRGEVRAREDYAETVYWHPALVLSETGQQRVTLHVADSVTRYRVLASAHTLDGRLGSHTSHIESRKPFNLEVKLPVELTANDKLDLPVVVVNDTDGDRTASLTLKPKNFSLVTGTAQESLLLKPNQRSRRIFRLQPSIVEGFAELSIDGKSEPFATDGVTKSVVVVPDGFPVAGSVSDLLEKTAEHKLELPADFVKGTLKFSARIYPTTLADLQKGLEGLLREPGGCFEQTSSSNYPNTLILQYLRESDQNNPEAAQRAAAMLARGYQRLTSFECQKPQGGKEGYEWFGGMAPPHEALTAYGLLEFKDMSQVSAVDADMLQRTRNYLLSRRQPTGGFARNTRALDQFGRAPQHITDAYILWALSETGKEDLTKDIDKLLKEQANSQDPYFLSLLGNTLLNVGRSKEALDVLKRVVKKQAADGGLDGAETSITCSGGRDLRIEATALSMLAWLKANSPADFAMPLEKAVKWLGQQRGAYGGFGSTQSTILALKALIAHTKANKKTPEGGTLMVYVNGKPVGMQEFKAEHTGPVTVEVPNAEECLTPGKKNDIRLKLDTKRSFPFTLAWSYHTVTPLSDDKCAVRLTTSLNKVQVKEGDSVRLTAVIENKGGPGKGQPMTVAVIGLPAGLKVPEDMKQLKALAELKKTGPNGELEAGDISFFEIRGRELVLYWRDLKPEGKIEVNLDLIANIPGEFHGAASRAYLYYNADAKCWVKPLAVQIEAQAAGE